MKSIFIAIFLSVSTFAFSQIITYSQWVERAANYIEANRFNEAATAFQQAMALDPTNENNPVLLLHLGVLQRHIGLLDDAYLSFTASLNLGADAEPVLLQRAALLIEMERFDDAMEDYNTILRRNPQNTEIHYRRGVLFLERGDRTRAEADFEAAERINPTDMYTLLGRALLYKLNDEWEAAIAIYTYLIDTVPAPNDGLFLSRAEGLVHTEQYFRAAADLRVLERSQRDNPFFFFLRGRVRLGQDEPLAARNDFRRARELGYLPDIDEWIRRTEW